MGELRKRHKHLTSFVGLGQQIASLFVCVCVCFGFFPNASAFPLFASYFTTALSGHNVNSKKRAQTFWEFMMEGKGEGVQIGTLVCI